MVSLQCHPDDLHISGIAAYCDNWVIAPVGFWESLDVATLQQLEEKALLMMATAFVIGLVLHYIKKL